MVLKPLGKHFWVLGMYGDSLGKGWSRCVFSTALSVLSKEAVQFWEEQTPPRKGVIVHLALGVVTGGLAGLIYRSVECWSWLPKQVPLSLGLLRPAAPSERAHPLPNHTHLSFPSASRCRHTCSSFALALAGTGWPASFLEYYPLDRGSYFTLPSNTDRWPSNRPKFWLITLFLNIHFWYIPHLVYGIYSLIEK